VPDTLTCYPVITNRLVDPLQQGSIFAVFRGGSQAKRLGIGQDKRETRSAVTCKRLGHWRIHRLTFSSAE